MLSENNERRKEQQKFFQSKRRIQDINMTLNQTLSQWHTDKLTNIEISTGKETALSTEVKKENQSCVWCKSDAKCHFTRKS